MTEQERRDALQAIAAAWRCDLADVEDTGCRAVLSADGMVVEHQHGAACPLADTDPPAEQYFDFGVSAAIDLRAGRAVEINRRDVE